MYLDLVKGSGDSTERVPLLSLHWRATAYISLQVRLMRCFVPTRSNRARLLCLDTAVHAGMPTRPGRASDAPNRQWKELDVPGAPLLAAPA